MIWSEEIRVRYPRRRRLAVTEDSGHLSSNVEDKQKPGEEAGCSAEAMADGLFDSTNRTVAAIVTLERISRKPPTAARHVDRYADTVLAEIASRRAHARRSARTTGSSGDRRYVQPAQAVLACAGGKTVRSDELTSSFRTLFHYCNTMPGRMLRTVFWCGSKRTRASCRQRTAAGEC